MKSQKISTASDQYFLSYVKKTTVGGGQIDPPPSRNRVKINEFWYKLKFEISNVHDIGLQRYMDCRVSGKKLFPLVPRFN